MTCLFVSVIGSTRLAWERFESYKLKREKKLNLRNKTNNSVGWLIDWLIFTLRSLTFSLFIPDYEQLKVITFSLIIFL
jgi:hypothetical protein